MTRDRVPCQDIPSVKKISNLCNTSEVPDPTEVETLGDVWKLSLLVQAHIAAALMRTSEQ